MIGPDTLRLTANHWRNIELAARNSLEQMRAGGVSGQPIVVAELTMIYAGRTADLLEERARDLEARGVAAADGGGS